jgi:hypothetical protein
MASSNVLAHIATSSPLPRGPRPVSEATLQAIRSIPLVDIAGTVVQLRRAGKRFMGLCPFHSERHASFGIDVEKNLWFCHGCQAGGDVITFVQKLESCDFRTAVNILALDAGIRIEHGVIDHGQLQLRAELRAVNQRIARLLLREELWLSLGLERLRTIIRTHTLEDLPCGIHDRLRRADARFVLGVMATDEDRLRFLSSSAAEQEHRIDQALDAGVVRSGKYFWEIPL